MILQLQRVIFSLFYPPREKRERAVKDGEHFRHSGWKLSSMQLRYQLLTHKSFGLATYKPSLLRFLGAVSIKEAQDKSSKFMKKLKF